MNNQRVSQLVQITPVEVAPNDLFLVTDISAHESKKMTADDLSIYISVSGSINALTAIIAQTASYINPDDVGLIPASNFASSSTSSSFASSAFGAVSSSYSATASVVVGTSFVSTSFADKAMSSSYAISSSISQKLIYLGANNGTAFNAISASRASSASHADYADIAGFSNTSNFANTAVSANTAITSDVALSLGSNKLVSYGIFLPHTSSDNIIHINTMSVAPTVATPVSTFIEAVGTAIVPITASYLNPNPCQVYLAVFNQTSLTETVFDALTASIKTDITATGFTGGLSGSAKIPFVLMGQVDISGSFEVYISSSSDIAFDTTRSAKFKVESISDFLTVQK